MKDVQTYTDTIEGFNISGIKINELKVVYHQNQETIVDVEGDLREYSISFDQNVLYIRTTEDGRHVRTLKNNELTIETMLITIPDSFEGFFDINSVKSNIIIKPTTHRKLRFISLNGVDYGVHVENVESKIEMNGVNSNMLIADFFGSIEYSGVSNKAIIHNLKGPTNIEIDGMSSKLTIYEHNVKNHYKVSLSGLSSKLDYYGQRRSSMGNINFQTQHDGQTPLITINGSGVSTRVDIQS